MSLGHDSSPTRYLQSGRTRFEQDLGPGVMSVYTGTTIRKERNLIDSSLKN